MKPLEIPPEKIGFDFDGVIADIGEAFLRLVAEEYNYTIKLDEITSFQVETCTNVPEKIVHRIFADILEDSLATGLIPIPGALEVIDGLCEQSRLKIITARSLDQPVMNWLEHYLSPQVCGKIDVIAMEDHDRKVQYIKEHDLHFFVDDRAETCVQVASANLHPLLFRQPWNRSWNNFTTVDNWQQLADHLSKADI